MVRWRNMSRASYRLSLAIDVQNPSLKFDLSLAQRYLMTPNLRLGQTRVASERCEGGMRN